MEKSINIFLGSSITELEFERIMLGDYIMNSIRPIFQPDGININLVKYEDIDLSYTGVPSQEVIDQLIRKCQICLFMFKKGAGKVTIHEFEVALNELKKEQSVVSEIHIYSFTLTEEEKSKELKRFQKHLNRKQIGLYWKNFNNKEDLRGRIEHDLILFERKHLGLGPSSYEKESEIENDGDICFSEFEKCQKAQSQLREKIHQNIIGLLQGIKKVMENNEFTIAERIIKVKDIYKKADYWASATNYDKKRYCELLFNYADFLDKYGLYYDSIEVYIRHIRYAEDVYGIEHVKTAISYNNLGEIYRKTANFSKARDYYVKALTIIEKTPGAGNPNNAIIYNNIGLTYYNQAQYVKARNNYQKAIDIHKKTEPEKHLMFANFINNMGSTYLMEGDHNKALEYFYKALEIQKEVPDIDISQIAFTYNNIALVLDKKGKNEDALEYYQKSLEIREKVLGKEHPSTATTYHNIGFSYYKMKKFDMALDYMNKALVIFQEKLGPIHPNTITVQNCIVNVEAAIRNINCQSSKKE